MMKTATQITEAKYAHCTHCTRAQCTLFNILYFVFLSKYIRDDPVFGTTQNIHSFYRDDLLLAATASMHCSGFSLQLFPLQSIYNINFSIIFWQKSVAILLQNDRWQFGHLADGSRCSLPKFFRSIIIQPRIDFIYFFLDKMDKFVSITSWVWCCKHVVCVGRKSVVWRRMDNFATLIAYVYGSEVNRWSGKSCLSNHCDWAEEEGKKCEFNFLASTFLRSFFSIFCYRILEIGQIDRGHFLGHTK